MNDIYRREKTRIYLKELRKRFTVQQICEGCGVSISAVFGWDKGKVPQRKEFIKLETFFNRITGTSKDWPPDTPDPNAALIKALQQRVDNLEAIILKSQKPHGEKEGEKKTKHRTS